MDFGLSEEQHQLKDSARAFLSGECPTTFVRKAMATDDGFPRELYDQIAKLGWTGLIVPEKFGGAGLGMLDMAVILEEGGYAAMPGPFLFSSVLAASALKLGGSDQLNTKWLTALAEGKAIGTVAIVEGAGSYRSARHPHHGVERRPGLAAQRRQDVRALCQRGRLHRRRRKTRL